MEFDAAFQEVDGVGAAEDVLMETLGIGAGEDEVVSGRRIRFVLRAGGVHAVPPFAPM
jgi:hypothetical protein